jgi:uncharacterized membrane protein
MNQTFREAARLEAFSDGVFAIAITLLALNLKIPPAESTPPGTLLATLLDQWPVYLAFGTSFFTILVMWVNHHNLFTLIRKTDHSFLLINGFLLFWVTFVPLPTALVAEYRRHPDQPLTAVIYSVTFLFIAVAFNLIRLYSERKNLFEAPEQRAQVRLSTRGYLIGPVMYGVAAAVGLFYPTLSVTVCTLAAIFFGLPAQMRSRLLGR